MRGVSNLFEKLIIVGLVLAVSTSFAGLKQDVGDDGSMEVKFLGQAHYSFKDTQNAAADEEDFYLRRGRIIISGQVTDGVKFFVETDNDNAGQNGAPSASTDIQDAWMDVRIGESDHWIQGGLILLPFSFENRSSAASLLGIDYNAEAIKLVNAFVWRDYGAELHGNIAGKVAYRVGAFDGYDAPGSAKNDEAPLRYTGHVALNVLGDVEKGGWFYSQNRLGKKDTYLAVGAGVDQQERATLVADTTTTPGVTNIVETDSENWVVDFQSSVKINDDTALLVNGAYYEWDNSAFEGNTAFVESGLLVGKSMVTAKYSLTDPDSDLVEDTEDITAGLHYFLKGQNARAGVEFRWGDSDDWTLVGIQFLL